MAEARTSITVSTKLRQVAERAKVAPEMAFTNVAKLIDLEFLREAYKRTRKDAAPGIDKQSAEQFAEHLQANLASLHRRMKDGTYRAPPVRRVEIPKGNGKTRPIGIPTFEDRVAQRAVAMVLDAIYEQDFLDCSFGFRTGKSPHLALETLWETLMRTNGGWIVEVDIRGFFDHLDHGHLKSFLDRRVLDKGLRRLIHKWLRAGVQTGTELSRTTAGTPQGGVISPILANVYLHEVADVWFEEMVKPALTGNAHLVRYADDLVMLFTSETDARRVMNTLPKRFGKFGLELATEKTRLIPFRRPMPWVAERPETFDFLGFTHYWGRSRRNTWVVKQKTARGRLQRAVKAVTDWLKQNRHVQIMKQLKVLRGKVRGHANYFGIRGNSQMVHTFLWHVQGAWRKWLSRRSHKARITWDKFAVFIQRYPLMTKPKLKPV